MNASPGFRWLGVAGVELSLADQVLVVDPYFTRIPFWRQWFGRIEPNRPLVREKLPVCNYLLVTHAHWDHVLDVPEVVRNTGAHVHGSGNTCRLLKFLDVPAEQVLEIRSGDSLTLGPFGVKVFPSEHLKVPIFTPGNISPNLKRPLRAVDYRMDSCFSFLISIGKINLLTDPGEHPGRVEHADVLLVNPFHNLAYMKNVLLRVHPRVVIPNHWDDLWRPLSKPVRPMMKPPEWSFPPIRRVNLSNFIQTVTRVDPAIRVLVPDMFSFYELSDIIKKLP